MQWVRGQSVVSWNRISGSPAEPLRNSMSDVPVRRSRHGGNDHGLKFPSAEPVNLARRSCAKGAGTPVPTINCGDTAIPDRLTIHCDLNITVPTEVAMFIVLF